MKEWAHYALPVNPRGPMGLSAQTGRYFREVSRAFQRAHRHTLREMAPGSEVVWSGWLDTRSAWAIDWHRSLGALGRDWTKCDRTEVTRRWVEFILHLSEHGIRGTWHAQFDRPVCLHFRHGLLKNVVAIRTGSHGDTRGSFALDTVSGHGRSAHRGSIPVSAWYSHRPHVCWRKLLLPFFSVRDMSQLGCDEDSFSIGPTDPIADEEALWNLARAAQLLDEYVPAYAKWVRRVIRHIVPLATSSGRTLSSSDAREPGVVRLSLAHDSATIAELLVHEVSHAYFHLLEQTGPVDDGSDQKLYYSPFKQANRPVGIILLTYHAFANVVLLYRALLRSRAPVSAHHILGEVNDTTHKLQVLERALFSTRALTTRGLVVRNALKERLVETGTAPGSRARSSAPFS